MGTETLSQALLTKEQKEAVGLLSIGTFLEYFDFMLYIHMAVLLNELFFPQYDNDINTLLTALTFFSTYLLRPIGALIFGWIGDNLGRRFTVIITTFMMAGSCVTMAILPTYNEIGITATWCVMVCRIVQGLSSMGEIIGAQVYLTEAIKPPAQYVVVTLLAFLAALGGTVSLGVASIATIYNFNWRIAFWIGAIIAVIGFIARTTLRETADFAYAKRRYKKMLDELSYYKKIKNDVFLIKIFDRLHNMQTINFKSIEKQQKIAVETIRNILPLAMSLGIKKVEELLTGICLQVMNMPQLQVAYSDAELKKKVRRIM